MEMRIINRIQYFNFIDLNLVYQQLLCPIYKVFTYHVMYCKASFRY